MITVARFASLSMVLLVAATGCSAAGDDASAGDEQDLTSAACSPTEPTVQRGATKNGTKVSTTMTSCISGNTNVLLDKLAKLSMNDELFKKADAFDKYEATKVKGSVNSPEGAERSVEIKFAVKGIDPSTTLKIVVKKEPGRVTFHAVNSTKFAPRALGFSLDTIVPANGLVLELTATAAKGGVTVNGSFTADVDKKYLKQFEKPEVVARFLSSWIERKVTE